MADGSVTLPEGFTLDPAPVPNKVKGMMPVSFTPQEQADSNRIEANPAFDSELTREIDRNKNNPNALAVLKNEQQKRGQSAPQVAELPPGFQLDQPAQAKPAAKVSTSDFLYGNVPISAKPIDYDKKTGSAEYILNEAKVGAVAGAGGVFGDIASMWEPKITDLTNPIGIAMTIVHNVQKMESSPGEPTAGTSAYIAKKLLGYDPAMQAPDQTTRFAGGVAQFAAGGIGGVARAGAKAGVTGVKEAARELGLVSTAAEAGSELGEKSTDSPIGGFIGSMLAVPAFAYLRKLPATARFIKGVASQEGRTAMAEGGSDFLEPIVKRQAEATLAQGLQEGGDKTIANIQQAADVQKTINKDLKDTGQRVTMSAGQASAAPRIVNAELEARKSSYSANAAAAAETEKNSAAVLSYIQRPDHPLTTTIKAAVDKSAADFNAQREALIAEENKINQRAQALPDTLPVKKRSKSGGLCAVSPRSRCGWVSRLGASNVPCSR